MKEYKYFVYYRAEDASGNNLETNGEVSLAREITAIKDVFDIEKYFREKCNYTKCIITNFILLSKS